MDGLETDWLLDPARRLPRSELTLDRSPGLYALFMRAGSTLRGFSASPDLPLYIGKADGAGGLKARCHFNGGTRTHSPRRSLAAILQNTLGLMPIRVSHTDGRFKSWGIDEVSERSLDQWMYRNLLVAIERCDIPRSKEKLLIARFAPLLNLEDCAQSADHRRISAERKRIADSLR